MVKELENMIADADKHFGYFPQNQLYMAKGAIDFARKFELITSEEYCRLSSECCFKINSPKYFDQNQ